MDEGKVWRLNIFPDWSAFSLHHFRKVLFIFLQLLIGFECGIVVLWDLKSKKADYRYNYDEVRHCYCRLQLPSCILIESQILRSRFFFIYIYKDKLFTCCRTNNFLKHSRMKDGFQIGIGHHSTGLQTTTKWWHFATFLLSGATKLLRSRVSTAFVVLTPHCDAKLVQCDMMQC